MGDRYVTSGYPKTTQKKATTDATAVAIDNAVGAHINLIRVVVVGDAGHIAIGAAPVATTGDAYVPAGQPEYFTIHPGQKVSVIRAASTDVTIYVTEMTQ